MGYLDPWLEQLQGSDGIVDVAGPGPDEELIIEEVAAEPELEIAPTIIDEPAAESAVVPADEEDAGSTEVEAEPALVEPELNLVDFSKLCHQQ